MQGVHLVQKCKTKKENMKKKTLATEGCTCKL